MKISTLGFPASEESKLGKILPLAKNQPYALVTFDYAALPDVVLLFGEPEMFPNEVNNLRKTPAVKLVVVAKQAPAQANYIHMPFPLVASRVLRVLESLSQPTETVSATNQVSPQVLVTHVVPTAVTTPPLPKEPPVPAPILAPVGASNQPSYRVLVVDDSLPMQKALAIELEKLAATVLIDFADSGEAALAITAEKEFDFIFLDIMMPGIDGFETCATLRKRPNMKKTPIIMLSAKTSPLDEVKGVISGCTTYLMKPIVHEEFQKVVLRITKWVDNFNARGQDASH